MDQKTSLLIKSQVPEYVREEYPKFISFLEAYYEFLETEQLKNGVSEKNDLIVKSKDFRYVSDIDYSLDQYEEQFYNTFISLLPKDTVVDKAFLIKNVLPLYQSKGNEKSFRFLFRLLFGEEINIIYPREQILRSSDGKWTVEKILRTNTEIYSQYVTDGSTNTFYLPYVMSLDEITVYLNGVVTEDYLFRKESRKVIFNSTPSLNDVVKIVYPTQFDVSIFNNRKLIGDSSKSYALVEKAGIRNVAGLNYFEFFINQKNIVGTFTTGENVFIDVLIDNQLIPFTLQTLSDVQSVDIINPGSNYKVGDSVTFFGSSKKSAIAVVDKISTGNIESLTVRIGNFGAGYKVGNNVYANNVNIYSFSANIDGVDDSGSVSPNTISWNTDIISSFSNVVISSANYGFPESLIPSPNVNTVIQQALTTDTITNLGPAINVIVNYSEITNNTTPFFIANSSLLFSNVRVSDLGSIGTIKVNDGGTGYSVGDEIVFNNDEYFSGQGAEAHVSSVSGSGSIKTVVVTNGGYKYRNDYLPRLTVNGSGSNANLEVQFFMGKGAEFDYQSGDGIPGKVLSIKVLDKGTGYIATPIGDLTTKGDGNATTNVQIRPSVVELPGRWLTSDSLLSSDEIKLEGENYYIDFSYVISSKVEFTKYKNIVKELLNPSGAINYSVYNILDDVDVPVDLTIDGDLTLQPAGTINVESQFITGTNTYFVVANTINLLSPGTYIEINGETRIVNSVINNTNISVSEAFTTSGNVDPFITIKIPIYNSLTTQYWREIQREYVVSNGNVSISVLTTEANSSNSIL